MPLEFTVALMSAVADVTIDYMLYDSANSDKHCLAAFEAFGAWSPKFFYAIK